MLISEIAKSWFLRLTWTIPHQKTPELTWAMFFPCYFAREYLFIYSFIDLLIDLKNQQRAEHFAADLCWIFPPPTILAALRLSSLSPSFLGSSTATQLSRWAITRQPSPHNLRWEQMSVIARLALDREKWHGLPAMHGSQLSYQWNIPLHTTALLQCKSAQGFPYLAACSCGEGWSQSHTPQCQKLTVLVLPSKMWNKLMDLMANLDNDTSRQMQVHKTSWTLLRADW